MATETKEIVLIVPTLENECSPGIKHYSEVQKNIIEYLGKRLIADNGTNANVVACNIELTKTDHYAITEIAGDLFVPVFIIIDDENFEDSKYAITKLISESNED